MILKRPYTNILKEYPQETAAVIAKVSIGENQLKHTNPNEWVWGFDFVSHVSITRDIINKTDLAERFKQNSLLINLYAKLGNSCYHSTPLKKLPINFQQDLSLSTKNNMLDHYNSRTAQLNLNNTMPIYIELYDNKVPYLQEHILIGSYLNNKKNNNNIIALSNSGLLCIYELENHQFSYAGIANKAFVTSIAKATHNINNYISYRNKKYTFLNAESSLLNILHGKDIIHQPIKQDSLNNPPKVPTPLTKMKMF